MHKSHGKHLPTAKLFF